MEVLVVGTDTGIADHVADHVRIMFWELMMLFIFMISTPALNNRSVHFELIVFFSKIS